MALCLSLESVVLRGFSELDYMNNVSVMFGSSYKVAYDLDLDINWYVLYTYYCEFLCHFRYSLA